MSSFDTECPRCHGKGLQQPAEQPTPAPAAGQPQGQAHPVQGQEQQPYPPQGQATQGQATQGQAPQAQPGPQGQPTQGYPPQGQPQQPYPQPGQPQGQAYPQQPHPQQPHAQQGQPYPPQGQAYPQQPYAPQKQGMPQVLKVILGVGLGCFVLPFVVITLFTVMGLKTMSETVKQEQKERATIAQQVTVLTTYTEVTYQFDSENVVKVTGELRNTGTVPRKMKLEARLYNTSNVMIASGTTWETIPAGETIRYSVDVRDSTKTANYTCRVLLTPD